MRKPSSSLLSLLSLLSLFFAPALHAADPTSSEALRQLFDTAWQEALQETPEIATYIGVPGHNGRWSDLSQAAIDRRHDRARKLLQTAQAIDRNRLTDSEKIDLDLFRRRLERRIEGFRFPADLLVIDQLNGIQQNVPRTFAVAPAATARDYDDQIARLNALPDLVDQVIALLEKGLGSGVTPPKITLRDVPGQVRGLLADDPLQSPLLIAFRQIPSTVTPDDRVRVTREALRAYQERAAPALRKLERYLTEAYIPGARETVALSALPNGADWYAYEVRQYTTTSLTPDQIHELGLSEVKRIRAEMDKVIASTGFKGTFAEFIHFLRTDPQFFYDKPEDLVNAYRVIAKRADPELAHLFGTLPRLPYGVAVIPDYEAKSQTTAYYDSGSLAAGRAGTYFVNTYDLKSRPKWEMEALTLHESVPGHHLQGSIAQELQGVPEWRKYDDYTAFVEGWGLYAESLGEEMGFYRDPYSKFGELTYEMWRAVRLVVDTGLHAKGWTRDQALAYFKANAAKTEHDIEVEVDRYIVTPGQAVAYKVGQMKIRELRAYAQKELGARFDVRAFHDEVLGHGALPLDLLEQNVKAWVARQKSAGSSAAAPPAPAAGVALRHLFDTAWQGNLEESPETATYLGVPGHNDRWSDLSPAGIERRRDRVRTLLQAAKAIDRTPLSEGDKLNLDLFTRRLERSIEGIRFPADLLVIDQLSGLQEDLPITFETAPAATVRDYEDQVARLNALPTLVDQTIALLEKGLAAGVTPPKVTLGNVPAQVHALVPALVPDNPLQSPLLVAFRTIPSTVPPDDRARITREGLRAYRENAAPALRKLERYLAETYVPGARETIALSALPDGAAWYAYNVRQATTTDLTPEQIHELGLAEVKRIRAEMDKVIAASGFQGTFEEFIHFLRTDPRFFYDKPEDLVDAYRVIAKRVDPELVRLFGKLPRLPYGVATVPDYDAKTRTTAYYNSGSLASGRPGLYFVNTYDVKSRPKWEMEPLTLHESVPGHHLQISLAEELTDLPEWRRYDNYPAFAEGWGLYAESLGEEMGFYRDPYSKFGELTYEMWRALRLVVDTGLHTKGWTRDQAIAYAKANTPRTQHEIEVEVDRYIVSPGGAVAYKVGQLKIKELRAYAEKELGAKFDVRAFHDQVLGHGSLPLDVLEKNIKSWVAQQKER